VTTTGIHKVYPGKKSSATGGGKGVPGRMRSPLSIGSNVVTLHNPRENQSRRRRRVWGRRSHDWMCVCMYE